MRSSRVRRCENSSGSLKAIGLANKWTRNKATPSSATRTARSAVDRYSLQRRIRMGVTMTSTPTHQRARASGSPRREALPAAPTSTSPTPASPIDAGTQPGSASTSRGHECAGCGRNDGVCRRRVQDGESVRHVRGRLRSCDATHGEVGVGTAERSRDLGPPDARAGKPVRRRSFRGEEDRNRYPAAAGTRQPRSRMERGRRSMTRVRCAVKPIP